MILPERTKKRELGRRVRGVKMKRAFVGLGRPFVSALPERLRSAALSKRGVYHTRMMYNSRNGASRYAALYSVCSLHMQHSLDDDPAASTVDHLPLTLCRGFWLSLFQPSFLASITMPACRKRCHISHSAGIMVDLGDTKSDEWRACIQY